ncbi:hypothetical protein GGR50DRAFT_691398 [Xylaria sp. CBS 124048]|nr:hypothetical protein GGR50DRAFT_691398 [Xylaria sp. CBS 124048]
MRRSWAFLYPILHILLYLLKRRALALNGPPPTSCPARRLRESRWRHDSVVAVYNEERHRDEDGYQEYFQRAGDGDEQRHCGNDTDGNGNVLVPAAEDTVEASAESPAESPEEHIEYTSGLICGCTREDGSLSFLFGEIGPLGDTKANEEMAVVFLGDLVPFS